jgi:hypothetical protein
MADKKRLLTRLLDAVIIRADALTALMLLVGLLGLATLPLHERRVKAEEKSLMIGGARSTLRSDNPCEPVCPHANSQ